MKDIARDLGVSVVTVSKVLRDHPDISPKTKERILKRVQELHYHPNWAARSLVTGRSYAIGLVVPTLVHPFFADVAREISRSIRRGGYNLVIASSEEDPRLEQQEIEHLVARQVDALIIASAQKSFGESLLHIQARSVPYVLIDRKFSDLGGNYVGTDDVEIGRLATNHLIEYGCRRIAHISGPPISTGSGRLEGYRQALERRGLEIRPEYLVMGRFSDTNAHVSGYEAMRQLMDLSPKPDGVFCFNDPIAMGAMKAIIEAGLMIPKDVAIIGAGNLEYDSLLRVPLSSIDQSSTRLGEQAAKLALGLIDSQKTLRPRTIILPCRVVARESSTKRAHLRRGTEKITGQRRHGLSRVPGAAST